jgi:uncharacterized protein YbbC (DUF1343 family)
MKQLYQIKNEEWVISSPNMPTLDTVIVYPGTGMFEGTSISEGRGTTKPFQLSGNPNVRASDIIDYFKQNVNLF